MASQERLVIFPSRANQVLVKQRSMAALRGINLLKRKRDAIDMKLREIKRDMQERQKISDDILKQAIFSFAKANFYATDFNVMLLDSCDHAEAFIIKRTQKVVGITLPQLDLVIRSQTAYPLTGLDRGGGQVYHVRCMFQEALKNLIAFASLDYSISVLAAASRQNNMRVNALDHVVLPRLLNTWNYIRNELEEFDREDFYRLKRSQAKQLAAKLAFSELIKMKNMTDSERQIFFKTGVREHPVADIAFDATEFEKMEEKKLNRLQLHKSSEKELVQGKEKQKDKLTKIPAENESGEDRRRQSEANQTDFDDEIGTQTDKNLDGV